VAELPQEGELTTDEDAGIAFELPADQQDAPN
jgi:hypothetical protein